MGKVVWRGEVNGVGSVPIPRTSVTVAVAHTLKFVPFARCRRQPQTARAGHVGPLPFPFGVSLPW